MNKKKSKDKNIIITGALGKLGRKVCKILNKSDFNIIALGRLLNKKKDEYKDLELITDLYDCDLSKEVEFKSTLKEILNKWNHIDGLITSTSYRPMKLGLEDSIENWNNSISQNSTAIYLPCKEVGKIMCNQKFGSIINISSIYGLGSPLKALYKGTDITTEPDYPFIKGGTIALTKYLASFYAEFNVRVNAIAPGGIFNNQNEKFLSNYYERVPLGRMATEEDVVNLIKFLLSEDSSYITGAIIPVDGGWSAT
tara:strand:+ start:367 stop:1128 length:762 start_codon:yes stop_codon:yes gene_type:complete